MYTRCPQCQTVFRITAAQLKARDGTVRCGRCQHVFSADRHMVPGPARGKGKKALPDTHRRATGRKPAGEPDNVASAAGQTAPRPHAATPEHHAAPPPLVQRRPARTRTVYWAAGWVLLLLLLAAQALVFYGHDFARRTPALQPLIDTLCDPLPCRRLPPIDMRHMDLVETQVTPHPRYDKALRLNATLVNRADTIQPYPFIEVSLIDSQGQLVARRAYRPREYLDKPETILKGMPPQVAVHVQFDITSPGAQASGYEVLLLPPSD